MINAVAATSGTGHCLKSHVDTARLPLRTHSENANDALTDDLRESKLLSVCDARSRRRASPGDLDSVLLPRKHK
jgi:hypothetical protein